MLVWTRPQEECTKQHFMTHFRRTTQFAQHHSPQGCMNQERPQECNTALHEYSLWKDMFSLSKNKLDRKNREKKVISELH